MTIAKSVASEGNLLAITDDAAVVSRYADVERRDGIYGAAVEIVGEIPILVAADDGLAALRQEGAGLPEEILVFVPEPFMGIPAGTQGGWLEAGVNRLYRKV